MKSFFALGVCWLASFYSYSQTTSDTSYYDYIGSLNPKVWTENILFDDLIKIPDGMVRVSPLEQAYGKRKDVPATLRVDLSPLSKFYVNKSELDSIDAEYTMAMLRGYELPYEVDLYEELGVFYMKQWEVTNAEYRFFWEKLGIEMKAKMKPDTTCWTRDFYSATVGPLATEYWSNPRYDDYPVVGVNYMQAKSFCKWYEQRLNEHYQLKGYVIEVDLPTQIEWAFINQTSPGFWYTDGRKQDLRLVTRYCDYDYFTNLRFGLDSSQTAWALMPSYSSEKRRNFIDDGYLFPAPGRSEKEIRKGPLKDEVNDIFYLNTNVSEWLSENYVDNWKPIYDWRQKTLRSIGTDDAILLADLEKFYNGFNDTINGQLVRGGNWYHEQHAYVNGINVGTQSAKAFVDPEEAHCTLGFRFVIRVVPIEVEDLMGERSDGR